MCGTCRLFALLVLAFMAAAAARDSQTSEALTTAPTPGAYALVEDVTSANFTRMVDFALIPGTNGQEAVVVTQQDAIVRRVSVSGAFAPTIYGNLADRVKAAGN